MLKNKRKVEEFWGKSVQGKRGTFGDLRYLRTNICEYFRKSHEIFNTIKFGIWPLEGHRWEFPNVLRHSDDTLANC